MGTRLDDLPNVGVQMVARSSAMRAVLELARQASRVNASVLVTGETGTGKDALARFIHQLSRRRSAPFLSVNCAALPESLLISELCGAQGGSFTGATDRPGVLRGADGGTVCLEEIAELAPATQAALLRIVETKRVRPVGSAAEQSVDVRLIATTHRDVRARIQHGMFREDLYHRLAVLEIHLPPLRDRVADIAPLAAAALRDVTAVDGLGNLHFDDSAIELLTKQPWPGNVRQLRNVVARSAYRVDATSIVDQRAIEGALVSGPDSPSPPDDYRDPSWDMFPPTGRPWHGYDDPNKELAVMREALRRCQGRVGAAARMLAIHRNTFRSRMQRLAGEAGTG